MGPSGELFFLSPLTTDTLTLLKFVFWEKMSPPLPPPANATHVTKPPKLFTVQMYRKNWFCVLRRSPRVASRIISIYYSYAVMYLRVLMS